jgi:sugar lactone lactonase YvrE
LPPGAPLDDPAARVLRDVTEMAWDRDGASVVYVADGKMRRIRVATDEEVALFDVRSDPFGARWLAVSPDGDTIYYVSSWESHYVQLITNFGDRPRPR